MFLFSGLSAAVLDKSNNFDHHSFEKSLIYTQTHASSFLDFFFEIVEINLSDDVPSDDDDNHEDDLREYEIHDCSHLASRHLNSSHTLAKYNLSLRYALALTATPKYTLYCCWKNDLV